MNEYAVVVKEGLYWIAKREVITYTEDGIYNYVQREVYEIDTEHEHNGFEYLIDAYSYIVHIQDKEAQNAVST